MLFADFLASGHFGLSEGSIYERLRRDPSISFDPWLAHGALIYDRRAALVLENVHREYLNVGQAYSIPMFALTDTWRASMERIEKSQYRTRAVNQDNSRFLRKVCASYGPGGSPIFIGGLTGPKGDAYTPQEAPAEQDAQRFHAPQIEALAMSGVDFLYTATLPAFPEARGIARAMSATKLPYVLSFVVRREGTLLDGTSLSEAIQEIDATTVRPPTCYAVNCVHPSVLRDALATLPESQESVLSRIQSFQANTSSKRPEELNGLAELETEEPDTLAGLMIDLWLKYRTRFMGGCCGTATGHIESLARKFADLRMSPA